MSKKRDSDKKEKEPEKKVVEEEYIPIIDTDKDKKDTPSNIHVPEPIESDIKYIKTIAITILSIVVFVILIFGILCIQVSKTVLTQKPIITNRTEAIPVVNISIQGYASITDPKYRSSINILGHLMQEETQLTNTTRTLRRYVVDDNNNRIKAFLSMRASDYAKLFNSSPEKYYNITGILHYEAGSMLLDVDQIVPTIITNTGVEYRTIQVIENVPDEVQSSVRFNISYGFRQLKEAAS
jgi:hypothetical protein